MSHPLKSPVVKVTLAMCVFALSMAGTLLAVEGTSGAAAPVVDHQLCYNASATGFKIPTSGVTLYNQFATSGFAPKIGALAANCNPVQKTITVATTGAKKVTKITNPNAHLACFKITASTQPVREVSVTNQFGTGTLNVGQPKFLCLPTWKSLTGPPKEPTPQPPGLNHFTCYGVSYVKGTAPYRVPGAVSLKDEFSTTSVPVTVGPPTLLCLPTEKVIVTPTGKKTYPIINATEHLLCFQVTQTPIKSPVYDLNQFGNGTVTIKKTSLLCLPSTKKVL